jgi:hypothetical protein
MSTGYVHCPKCLDKLNFQRKLLVIPPDPPPLFNTRPEPYYVDEVDFLTTETTENIITTESGVPITTEVPNPGNPLSASIPNPGATCNLVASLVYHSGSVGSVFLDLFQGDPKTTGISVLAAITGSALRANAGSQMGIYAATNIAINTTPIVLTTSSVGNNVNVGFVGVFNASSGGTLLTSGSVAVVGNFITKGNAVQFDSNGLIINLN